MIDVERERLIPIREVPQNLPRRPNGKCLHVSSVRRWIKHGVRGAKLESIVIGGATYTSFEAIQRFGESLTEEAQGSQPLRTPRMRQREIDRADQELRRILSIRE